MRSVAKNKEQAGPVTAARARALLPELLSKVAFGGERVVISRNGKPTAVLVSIDDLRLLQAAEDEEDGRIATKRLKSKAKNIPYDKVMKGLGLK